MDLSKAKAELRKKVLDARPGNSGGLSQQLVQLVQAFEPTTLASYVPLANEPDVGEFNRQADKDLNLVFPRIVGDSLEFASGTLVSSALGLMEPTGDAVANDTIDLILVPALAVDRSGNRLGKGKGFYDRFLAECKHPKLIAVVFDDEVFDSIPTEPFDKPVDGVVTPSGWWLVQSR